MIRLFLLLLIPTGFCFSQTQTIALNSATELEIIGQLSNIEIILTDGNQIDLRHHFSIDGVSYSEECEISNRQQGSRLIIREENPTEDRLNGNWSMGDHYIGSYDLDDTKSEQRNVVEAEMVLYVPRDLELYVVSRFGGLKGENLMNLKEVDVEFGNIELSYSGQLPSEGIDITSEFGSIDLSMPADVSATVGIENEFGDFNTEFPLLMRANMSNAARDDGQLTTTINGGGPTIQLSAKFSDISLTKL